MSIRLNDKSGKILNDLAKKKKVKKSTIIRQALDDFFTLQEFESLNQKLSTIARQKYHIYTDEDVAKWVS